MSAHLYLMRGLGTAARVAFYRGDKRRKESKSVTIFAQTSGEEVEGKRRGKQKRKARKEQG